MTEPTEPTEPIARIEAALAGLGAEHEPPVGWEARVLAAAGARQPRRWWWALAPVAVLAVLVLALWRRSPDPIALGLDVAVEGGPLVRGGAAHIGQTAHAVATGSARYRALWIYRRDRLVAACPGDPRCQGADRIDLPLSEGGSYRVVALASAAALPVPTGAFDRDVADALSTGASKVETELTVQ
jgi:hypothetical protein